MTDIKFCGLTRREDAREAGRLGAAFVGAIFAGGPRLVTPEQASHVLDGCESGAKRVGVFGAHARGEIERTVEQARLDVIQLHGDPSAADIAAIRDASGVKVWAVVRVTSALPPNVDELLAAADALLIDSRVPGVLGGSGVAAEWDALRPQLASLRNGRTVVLAGGLTPENVVRAVGTLRPDVVDVSSGVESAPGIKDHARMRAFAAAVADAGRDTA